RDPGPDHRAACAGRRTRRPRTPRSRRDRWSEDLTTLVARAVLAALAARPVREVLGVAGGVGAVDQGRRHGLPLRTTVTRVAARHLPLRDCHFTHSPSARTLAARLRRLQNGRMDRRTLPPAPRARPIGGRWAPRAGVPGHPPGAHRTRCTTPDSRPGTAA